SGPIVALDPGGNPVVAETNGRVYKSMDNGLRWEQISKIKPANYIQSFGILHDGTMIAANNVGSPTVTEVIRTENSGRTWRTPIRIDPRPFDFMGGGNCMRITQPTDGPAVMTTGNLYLTALEKFGLDLP